MSLIVSVQFVEAQAPPNQPRAVPTPAWAPKPTTPPGYRPPQRPWVKLSALKARHTGESSWRELLVEAD